MRRSLAILLLAPERRPGTLLRRPAGTVPPPLPEPGDRDRAGHRGADRPGGRHARGQRAGRRRGSRSRSIEPFSGAQWVPRL